MEIIQFKQQRENRLEEKKLKRALETYRDNIY